MNLFLLAILTFVAGARSPFPPNGSCARADAESGRLVSAVTRWSAAGDSVFNIPPVDSAEIQVETDESVCAKLIEAYSKLPGEVDTPASLYVVKLGKVEKTAPPGAFIPSPVKVPVGGAVMFVLNVEQFNRF